LKLALALTFVALFASASARHASGDYWVCVTNERSGDLTVIDGATRQALFTVPLGKRPRGIHASPDGRTLYVALTGSVASPPGAPPSTEPPDRNADGIGVVDLARRKVVRMIHAGIDPEEFAVSPDGAVLVVSNEDAALATAVRVRDGATLARGPVHAEPEGVAFTPRGDRVFVTCEADGSVLALDPSTLATRATYTGLGRPRSIAFVRDASRAFVPSEIEGVVREIDLSTRAVLRTFAMPKGSKPMQVRLSGDGATLSVSNGRGGTVGRIDLRTGRIRTVPAGTRPWGMGMAPGDRFLWVANGPSDDVSLVDLVAGREVARIRAGQGPWGVTVVRPVPKSG
jgi:YVTN family beta-propeller protein